MLQLVAVHEAQVFVPVTAKLSRRFYEQLGDEIANELVDWLNAVDESYRNEIRELHDVNREWFRAEMATLRGEVRDEFAAVSAEFRAEFGSFRLEIERRFARIDERFAQVDTRLAEQRAELLKWMFVFWTATVIPLAGLMVALSDVFRS